MNETHTISTADGDMGVHIVRPDGDGPYPVVIFFHHGPGLDGPSKTTMQLIADRGYYVISHDRYHREGPWWVMTPEMRNDEEATKRFWAILMNTTEDMVDTDLASVFAHVDSAPAAREGKMACVGYCIGARSVVVGMARHNDRFAAGGAFHPSFCTTDGPDSPHLLVPSIEGSLYTAFGSEDKMQSPEANVPFIENVRNMPDGRGEADIHEGANHGFAVIGSPPYHEAAANASYAKTFALFAKVL